MDYELWFHKEHTMPDHVDKHGSVSHMAFDEWRPATPEEIKAFHGKCETCKYYEPDELYCNCPDNFICAPEPTDYCNHHEPKET